MYVTSWLDVHLVCFLFWFHGRQWRSIRCIHCAQLRIRILEGNNINTNINVTDCDLDGPAAGLLMVDYLLFYCQFCDVLYSKT